jgi:hypothetical protein
VGMQPGHGMMQQPERAQTAERERSPATNARRQKRRRRVSQRGAGTALHARWLQKCVCNSLRQTQRPCWLQMAGCGLGVRHHRIDHRPSHPRARACLLSLSLSLPLPASDDATRT